MSILRRTVLWGFAGLAGASLGLAQVDTVTKSQPRPAQPISAGSELQHQIPGLGERALMFGAVVVLFGGLGWILNAKRRVVDREANM